MSAADVVGTMVIALLATTTVSLWTARVALVFRMIASNLDALDRLAGYAAGVAAGTLVGLYANDRLSSGQSSVHVTVPGHRPDLGPAMNGHGWPTTTHEGSGPHGPITTVLIVVDDPRLAAVLDDVRVTAPDGFVTVHQLRRVHPVPLPAGMHQAGARRRLRSTARPLRERCEV